MKAKLVKGKDLTPAQVEQVKAAFIYRYTVDNPVINTRPAASCATQTDRQWIDSHAFYFRKDGRLANRPNHCEPLD